MSGIDWGRRPQQQVKFQSILKNRDVSLNNPQNLEKEPNNFCLPAPKLGVDYKAFLFNRKHELSMDYGEIFLHSQQAILVVVEKE